ncbi:hypothetical protein QQP08_007223 [Theobroma cacao]|nr:hypothetical protein QQP08_007223 [Theobroma cacao]
MPRHRCELGWDPTRCQNRVSDCATQALVGPGGSCSLMTRVETENLRLRRKPLLSDSVPRSGLGVESVNDCGRKNASTHNSGVFETRLSGKQS